MAMANMNLIGVFVTKLWSVLACGGGGGGRDGDVGDGGGGATKNIITPKFSNFGDIINNMIEFKSHNSPLPHLYIIQYNTIQNTLLFRINIGLHNNQIQ